MATITGKTSEEEDELFDEQIISGRVQDGNLILTTRGGSDVLAGYIGYGTDTPPDDSGPSDDATTYATAAANSFFAIYRDSLTGDWPSSRPSARTDLTFDVTGIEPSPSWLLANDRRSIPMPEGGMIVLEGDLTSDSGGGGGGGTPQTYETVLPTSYFIIFRDATTGNWPASRPTARTDITIEACGLDPSPNWLLTGDRRTLPKS